MNPDPKAARRTKIGKKKKIAFVMSGGAAKAGAFHLGVALALREAGFTFTGGLANQPQPVLKAQNNKKSSESMEISVYVGSSAGSLISTFLAAGYNLENIFNSFLDAPSQNDTETYPKPLPKLHYSQMLKLRHELAREQVRQFFGMRKVVGMLLRGEWESLVEFQWLNMTGLFSTRGIEEYLREQVLFSNNFQDYLAELFIVATHLNHSKKVVFGKYNLPPQPDHPGCVYKNDVSISHAVAASTALPPLYAPYKIDTGKSKTYYIDGEIRDTLSTHVAEDAGADLIIASYTHQPYHYNKEVGSLSDLGLPAILVQSIFLLVEQKINQTITQFERARTAIAAVSDYCKQQGISDEHRKRISEILEAKLVHRSEVDRIYIHPKANDVQFFRTEHFSLSPHKMTEVVRSGFRAAIDVLRRYDFADHPRHRPATKENLQG